MAKRFNIPSIPKGEVARYVTNPFESTAVAFGGLYARTDKDARELTVRPQDELLIQKGGVEAFNVYQKLLFDETVSSAMSKLTQEVTDKEWKLEAPSDSPGDLAVKEFVEQRLQELQMDEITRAFMESYIVGFTVAEVMWRRTPSGVIPYDVRFRDQRRFRFQENEEADYGFSMRMATREDPMLGIVLPARKFIAFRYWVQANGDPYGAGLGRILYPLVKFKRRALESQLLYSDRFANPTAVAKAPLSATACEVDTLYDHLSNLSQETALVLPEGFEIEFVNPGGTPESFEKLRNALTSDISLLIAGEDEAGNADSGSRASSEVAQNVRVSRAKDISELVSFAINDTLIRWIVDLNFGTNVIAPKLYRDFDPKEDVQLNMSDVATLVKDIGLMPSVEWITDRFNVELEDKKDEIEPGSDEEEEIDEEVPQDEVEEEVTVEEEQDEGPLGKGKPLTLLAEALDKKTEKAKRQEFNRLIDNLFGDG